MRSNKKGIGILTFALNSTTTDYERLAYMMALSYKATNKHQLPLAVIVNDRETCMPELHHVYEYIFSVGGMANIHPMHHEAYIQRHTPFSETIKVECDMLFTGDIYHWIRHMRLFDICFTNQIYDFNNQPADDSYFRKYIYQNNLPNIYNGIMYVRHCKALTDYMKHVRYIFENWEESLKEYRMFEKFPPSTDFAMAMACHKDNNALSIGINPTAIPGFTHAKPTITHKTKKHWHEELDWCIKDPSTVIVNGVKAAWPIHYYDKNFITDEMLDEYATYI